MSERTMWAVGTDSGDFDYQAIDAPTRDAAIAAYATKNCQIKCDRWAKGASGPCALPCDWCGAESAQDDPRDSIDAVRVPSWDRLRKVTAAAWIRAGFGTFCDWCGYETFAEEGAVVFRGKATCQDCRGRRPWITSAEARE